ncbi:MAG: cysteine hydrolase family protein [Bacteroidales bacterium]|jgi:nicotinamidase-related amidase|nr:cysteine hydrolase family protein [Bacteroidales bacterium]
MMKKYFIRSFLLISLLFSLQLSFLNAQKSALVIIDIQDFYFPGGDLPLDNPELAAHNASLLLEHFRSNNLQVVHVRHNYEPGGGIHKRVCPGKNELVISKDQVNAFLGTKLDSILRKNSITDLVLCGMQTNMCLEAATRAASDLGYSCTVVEDACATRKLKYGDEEVLARDVHLATLATLKSYAKIMSAAEFLGKE